MFKRFFIARCKGGEMTEKSTPFKIGHSAAIQSIHPTLILDFPTLKKKLGNFSYLINRIMTLQKIGTQQKDSRVFKIVLILSYFSEEDRGQRL
jgi:hypothetical protein